MCCCHKEITEKVTKYIVECNSSDGFWDVKLGDVANITLAVVTVALSIYVFVYQRKKDKKDHATIINQMKSSIRLEMYKLLIVEPNVNNIHDFFQNVNRAFQILNNVSITQGLINAAQSSMDTHCNDFEENFLELLDGVDKNFYNKMLGLLDKFRDEISNELNELQIGSVNNVTNFEDLYYSFKTDFISGLYNFNNLDLNE